MIIRTLSAGIVFVIVALDANAQDVKLRLLNGKTGAPMGNQTVIVSWVWTLESGVSTLESVNVRVNADGIGIVTSPGKNATFGMLSGTEGENSNKIAFINCNDPSRVYDFSEVYKVGVVPENRCGKAKASVHPGEIVFWAKPRGFWDFQ